MLHSGLADLVGKMTKQAHSLGFDSVEEALDHMEELHTKAIEMSYPDLAEAMYDLGHYRLGDPSVHDREFEESARRLAAETEAAPSP